MPNLITYRSKQAKENEKLKRLYKNISNNIKMKQPRDSHQTPAPPNIEQGFFDLKGTAVELGIIGVGE